MSKWKVLIVLGVAQFVMVLDSTVMNVSISKVVADLHTTVSGLQAAITFYTLTMAALMLTGGKLGDIWGRLKAFRIGAIIYALGSLITGLSPNLAALMFGWSFIEGLGAVLVIPAIAALVAMNYSGKDRAIAFSAIGAIAGVAAALGPLIGGVVSTYSSWRYVFIGETVVMVILLLFSKHIQEKRPAEAIKWSALDIPSVVYSALGMALFVLGVLQSKTWGWIRPLKEPVLFGHAIAPFGISLTVYFMLIGASIIWLFYRRQTSLLEKKKSPLLDVRLFLIKQLRSGLSTLGAQYVIIAAVFFVIPVYLQMLLGYDPLKTGLKILPLSAGLMVFAIVGSKLLKYTSPKKVVRIGQLGLAAGALCLVGSVDTQLKSIIFGVGMFIVGSGLGLLASQLGNVNLSSVPEDKFSETGGLQGTFQNLGSSLGTAVIGSILIFSLTAGFVDNINSDSTLPSSVKTYITNNTQAGVQIVPVASVQSYAVSKGATPSEGAAIASNYGAAQAKGLKVALFFVFVLAILSLPLSRNIPDNKPHRAKA